MTNFTKGFKCALCGPIEKAKTKTINKIPHNICPECMGFVEVWERPLNERSGRCSHCAYGSFTSAIVKGDLLRCCKRCLQVENVDKNMQIVRKGKEEFKYVNDKKD
jgi:hypothetical protein